MGAVVMIVVILASAACAPAIALLRGQSLREWWRS